MCSIPVQQAFQTTTPSIALRKEASDKEKSVSCLPSSDRSGLSKHISATSASVSVVSYNWGCVVLQFSRRAPRSHIPLPQARRSLVQTVRSPSHDDETRARRKGRFRKESHVLVTHPKTSLLLLAYTLCKSRPQKELTSNTR